MARANLRDDIRDEEAATLLARTLEEEKEADVALNSIAEQLNLEVPREEGQSKKRTANNNKTPNRRTKSAA
jgi:ferritin-like metal-binding protein YciE